MATIEPLIAEPGRTPSTATSIETELNAATPERSPINVDAILKSTRHFAEMSPAEAAAEDDRVQRAYERFCGQSRAQVVSRLMRQFFSPIPGFADADFSTFDTELPDQQSALATARRYADTWPGRRAAKEGLLLYGMVGNGKTHLAIATAREIMRRHQINALFVSGANLFRALRDAMDDRKSEASVIGPLVATSLLVLDDPLPSAGALTEWQAEVLKGLVDDRYRAGRPLIVTVNAIDGHDGAKRIGGPTWSRLRQGWAIACAWPDHRQPTHRAGSVSTETRRAAECAK